MLRIRIRTPTDPDVVREFTGADRISFGRDPDNDLVLDATYVSRSHGELAREDNVWSVFNWGSRTPIAIRRGSECEELPRGLSRTLRDGDVVQILHTRLEIRLPSPGERTEFGLPFVRDEIAAAQEDATEIGPAAAPLPCGTTTSTSIRRSLQHAPVDMDSAGRNTDIQPVVDSFADALLLALEARQPAAAAHSRRTGHYAAALSLAVDASASFDRRLGPDEIHALYLAGLLHDVGKLMLRDTLLRSAPSEASEEVKQHAARGASLLDALAWPDALTSVPRWVRLHHERLDGSGYPEGLRADAIPLEARILQVVDVFDAASARRGNALDPAAGTRTLEREARAGRLDPALVTCWLSGRAWAPGKGEDTEA